MTRYDLEIYRQTVFHFLSHLWLRAPIALSLFLDLYDITRFSVFMMALDSNTNNLIHRLLRSFDLMA